MNTQLYRIIRFTASELKVEVEELLSERRQARVVKARQTAMWLARQLTGMSTNEIGRAMNRDHTTVMHGVERTERRRKENETWRQMSDELLERLRPKCEVAA